MANTFIVKQDHAIDVSYYEPIWYERADYGKVNPKPKHVIARATYGVRQDTEFVNHWNYWRDKGVPVAAYHYWYGVPMYSGQTASDGIGDQAENFIKQIRLAGYTGKEKLWLDLEEYGNTSVPNGKNYRNLVKQWLDHVEREIGQKPGIYSRKDQLERMMINNLMPDWINNHDMWWAWYPDGPYIDKNIWFPTSTKYRPSWYHREPKVWQYSDGGFIDGFIMKDNHQPTTYDFNVMLDGYLESLGEVVIPPDDPPTGETMITATVNSDVLNFRSAPVVSSGNILPPQVVMNDKLEGDVITAENWMHVTKVNGVARVGYVAAWLLRDIVNSTPPPTGFPVLHMTATADGYETKAFDLNPL